MRTAASALLGASLLTMSTLAVTATPAAGADPAACDTAAVPVGAVQGSSDTSPLSGATATVRGVVVGDYQGASPALGGFYLQDAGDGDAATSDGVFVFTRGSGATVALGDVVTVTGAVSEFQGQTQLTVSSRSGSVTGCGTGDVSPTDVRLPLASPTALERFEGMLVRLPQRLSVTETFQLGRFGEVRLSSGGRLRQPTDVVAPGSEAVALQQANARNVIRLDDGLNAQNPDPIVLARGGRPLSATNTLRGGDTVRDATGVLTYTWAGNAASPNAYRVRPTGALHGAADAEATNPRPRSAPPVGGRTQVASANLLNLFDSFGDTCRFGTTGATAECRGADDQEELDRQLAKSVAALRGVGADVVGVMEVENDGYAADSALGLLTRRLNAAASGPERWAYVDVDARTGVVDAAGSDAIKSALLYRADEVSPVRGATWTDTASDVWERRPVAQTFRDRTGRDLTVVVNHFKSKGSCPSGAPGTNPDADQGDGQSCWNARRTQQAQRLAAWVRSTVVPGAGDPDVLLLGDFNAYAQEDPVRVLQDAGWTDLVRRYQGSAAYSYVFAGQWGSLDHAFASPSLLRQVTGAADHHVNADEPSVLDYNTEFKSAGQLASLYAPDQYRSSDHDPVRVGVSLRGRPDHPRRAGGR